MPKKFLLTGFSLLLLLGCSPKDTPQPVSDAQVSPNATQNAGVTSAQTESVTNQATPKTPTLPSAPSAQTPEEAAKELGLDTLNTPLPELAQPDDIAVQNSEAVVSAQAKEAMNPDSSKNCDTYESQMLKDLCSQARGLSSN